MSKKARSKKLLTQISGPRSNLCLCWDGPLPLSSHGSRGDGVIMFSSLYLFRDLFDYGRILYWLP